MKGPDILKWSFIGWLTYKFFKELSQPASDINYDNFGIQTPNAPETLDTIYPVRQPPQPTWNSLTNLDINKIIEEAFNKTLGQTPLIEVDPIVRTG
jgi:hypothetical protein